MIRLLKWTGLLVVVLCIPQCAKEESIFPKMSIPGYKTKLLFQDDFNSDLSQWHLEGLGKLEITTEEKLQISLQTGNQGIAIWALPDFSDDFQLEYEVFFSNSRGLLVTAVCARGLDGDDLLQGMPTREGQLIEYTRSGIGSYHISAHNYTPDGEHDPYSKLRKNPGHMMLSSQDDPCAIDRQYDINIIKLGNRIQYYVDGELIHDIRDKGGFGPVYDQGKFGFILQGNPRYFHVHLDNVHVFKLIPE